MISISSSERKFIAEGIGQDVRNDGRQRMDWRHFSLQTGVIAHANGSARIKCDTTDIMVAINLEIGEPDDKRPNEGKIMCAVDCTASASQDFENKGAQNLNSLLSNQLQKIIGGSNGIDKKRLCVIPGQTCWVLYIDALVLDSAGSLLDSIALCTRAALADTRIPSLSVIPADNPNELTIEVNDDPYESLPFDYSKVPIIISLTKIGTCFVVDASAEEEVCMSTRLAIGINQEGNLCGMEKTGPGGIAPTALLDMLKCAGQVGKQLINLVDNKLHVMEASGAK